MQYEAAKPKGASRNEDAPKQEPMRGSDSQVRRNPSTDQKKVRRQMAKKASDLDAFSVKRGICQGEDCGVAMAMPDKSNQDLCPNCLDSKKRDVAADQDKSFFDQTKASLRTANRGDRNLGYGDFDGPEDDDDDDDDDDKERDEDHLEYNPLDEIERWERRTSRRNASRKSDGLCDECATKLYEDDNYQEKTKSETGEQWCDACQKNWQVMNDPYFTGSRRTATQFDTRADKLNPGQHVRTPTGGTTQVRRVRNHESSGKHVYVDTDLGTTVVPRGDAFEVVPQNARQQESPGYGTPGGNSNTLPFDPHGPGGSNTSTSSSCPVCGTSGSLRRSGDHYTCSKCGFQETFGGTSDKNYSSSTQVIRTFTNKNNNRRTASVIAQRARQVLDLEENQ